MHLIQKGYSPASSREEANTAVLHKFSFGQGHTVLTSIEGKIVSSINYPRFFQLTIVDLVETKLAGKPVLIYQGEVYSNGESLDTPQLAKLFLGELFENFASNVKEKSFHKLAIW